VWKSIFLAAALVSAPTAAACAQSDLFSAAAFSGMIDLRLAAADGEAGWLDGGFGKARFGGGPGGGWETQAVVADAIVEWKPNFGWSVSGVFDLEYQSDLDEPLGFTEAYLQYKPLRPGRNRYSARLGMFYPPVSLEHDGPAWTTTRTITPSAINSWIGEEVKGAGLEGSVRRVMDEEREAGVSAGLFQFNDPAGTLIAFRGWSLNDVRTIPHGTYALPPLSGFVQHIQPPFTTPSLELDNHTGFYVRGDWRPAPNLAFNAIRYDNVGDMVAINKVLEWSWRTQFNNVGMAWKPAEGTEVLAQAMFGRTRMGYPSPHGMWIHVDYRAAYVLVSRAFGETLVTGRVDAFSNDDQADPFYGDTNEDGWAATAAIRRRLNDHTQFFLEAMRIESDRPSRALAGEAARQTTTVIQASTRLSF
jgi:hypothetical protein